MSKYQPLSQWLSGLSIPEVQVSFEQIEAILGFDLPASARTWMAWWENETYPVRSQCKAWANAGFHTRHLDLSKQTVVFVRTPPE